MTGRILMSTAYLPPAEYFSLIVNADTILIEKEENYLKQSYRNRCYLLSAHGTQILSVPVLEGSRRKVSVKDIRIDYSKRWQQVHLGALCASYRASPYFEFFFDAIEKIILNNHTFLIDLNMDLTEFACSILGIEKKILFTIDFEPPGNADSDFRYSLSPKKESSYQLKDYIKVFNNGPVVDSRISIVDLIFNNGREAVDFLKI
jgi:hypothetical protein